MEILPVKIKTRFGTLRRPISVLFFCLYLAFPINSSGQEIPAIITYDRNQYDAGLKNWSFAEDDAGNLFVANNEGILIFNGLNWQKVFLPNHRVPRCLFRGYDGKIYAGGFETIGYVDRSDPARPVFIEIGGDLLKGSEEEIWHITGSDDQIMFQSFSIMVFKDSNGLELYRPGDNIMFGNWIDNRLFVPQIQHGIYVFDHGVQSTFTPQGLPRNAIVSGVAAYQDHQLLIATRNFGLFVVDTAHAIPVSGKLNDNFKDYQINNLIRLKNGDYAIGTIQNGVYVTTPDLQIKYHVNKTNGLANNSVLALYETREGALCIGLNIGMNILHLHHPGHFYYDVEGKLGSIFATIYHNNHFYVGTNQGVFIQNQDGKFSLVPGSQGQVWSLTQAGSDLLCGHNAGTLQLFHEHFELVSPFTGVFHMQLLNDHQILQSTYNGLVLLEKNENIWNNPHRITGTDKLVDRFIYQSGQLLGLHPYFGLVYYQLDLEHNRITDRKTFQDREVNIGTNTLGLAYLNNKTFVQIDSAWWELGNKGILAKIDTEHVQNIQSRYPDLNFRILKPINNNSEQNRLISYFPERNEVVLSIEEGYSKHNPKKDHHKIESLEIDYLQVNNQLWRNPGNHLDLKANEHNLTIQLAPKNGFLHRTSNSKYRLEGYDSAWRNLPDHGVLEFKQLNHGRYHLYLSHGEKNSYSVITVSIHPYWYESWQGIILYVGVIIFIFWAINQRNKKKLKLETERLRREKEIALEAERIRARTEKLEHEVAYKSKMLANSAMTMVQKNNMLNELKEVIKSENSASESLPKFKQKLIKLINRNINSDEAWEIFDRTFAEVHEDFIERFTTSYPDVSPGDLRLAAYIRMNMSSKEIAPILQISVRSVENKRYRLRKKMNLDPNTNLSEYLMRF